MRTYHKVRDQTKLEMLMASMEANGWQGAPLVVWDGEYLLTGSHRYAAAKCLGWTDSEIPTIEISDVFVEAGLDFAATLEEEQCEGINDPCLVYVIERLPVEVRDAYGLDIH